MKYILIATLFLSSILSFGQCVTSATQTCTPNIQLALPAANSYNWNTPLNLNFTLLDLLLSGHANLTGLSFTNGQIAGNVTFTGAIAMPGGITGSVSHGGPDTFNGPVSFPGGITGSVSHAGQETFSAATSFPGGVSGNTSFSGNGAFSGNLSAGLLQNGTALVGTGTFWTGADVTTQINSAYASLPAQGGKIHVVAGAYTASTGVLINTASKPAAIECDSGTTITWLPTSGTMFTFNYGNAGSLHDRSAGIFGCTLIGPSSGTAQAIVLGGLNGAEGFKLSNSKVAWNAGTAITWGNNTWGTKIDGSTVIGQVTYNFGSGLTGSGEDVEITNTLAQGITGGYVGCATLGNSGLALNIFGSSFDDCQLVLGAGYQTLNGTHVENPGQRSDSTSNPSITSAGNATFTGIEVLQDAGTATKAQEISVTGGNLTIFGGSYTSNATIATFLTNSGSGSVSVIHGPQAFGGYTAGFLQTNAGEIIDFLSNGTSGPTLTIYTSSGNQGIFTVNGPTKSYPAAFATLPTCNAGAEGMTKPVNDSTVVTYNSAISGSGANHVIAYCDGTSWKAH